MEDFKGPWDISIPYYGSRRVRLHGVTPWGINNLISRTCFHCVAARKPYAVIHLTETPLWMSLTINNAPSKTTLNSHLWLIIIVMLTSYTSAEPKEKQCTPGFLKDISHLRWLKITHQWPPSLTISPVAVDMDPSGWEGWSHLLGDCSVWIPPYRWSITSLFHTLIHIQGFYFAIAHLFL